MLKNCSGALNKKFFILICHFLIYFLYHCFLDTLVALLLDLPFILYLVDFNSIGKNNINSSKMYVALMSVKRLENKNTKIE